MKHIRKKGSFKNLFSKRALVPFLIVLSPFIILSITFFVTKETKPHVSELAFTEYSSLGKNAGSVIPASCESSVDHGETQTCSNGSVISTCSSCPPTSLTVNISPSGTQGITLGESISYSSVATGNGVKQHDFNWRTPSGVWNWQSGGVGGTTNVPFQSLFSPRATNSRSIAFTPDTIGTYTMRFAALDNGGGAWVHSTEYSLIVCGGGYIWSPASSSCIPSVSIGTFSYSPVTSPDVDYGETATLSWSGITNATSCSLSGGEYSSLSVGTASTGNRTTSSLTSDTTYTLTCEGPGGPVSKVVIIPVASGSISANPAVCTILPNMSSCNANLTWSTINMSSPRVTNGSNVTQSTAPQGSGVPLPAYFGNNTFAIKNGNVSHASTIVNAACDSSSAWNGVVCLPSGQTSYINSVNCSIAINASTCAVDVTWSSLATSSVTVTRASLGDTLFASGNSGTQGVTLSYGTHTFSLKEGGTVVRTGTYTASCVYGTEWNGSICSPSGGSMSGTINSTSCSILVGASSCELPVIWSTVNTIGNQVTVVRPYDGDSVFGAGASGNQMATFNSLGTWNLLLRSNGYTLATGTYSTVCAPLSSWNGSSCVLSGVSGNLNVSANACQIATGASACTIDATWSTSGATNPSLYKTSSLATLSTQSNRMIPFPVSIPYGGTQLELREGVYALDTEFIAAACVIGSYDTSTGTCVNPTVFSLTVTGQYYAPSGVISLTCSNSNSYRVVHTETGTVVSSGTYSSPRSISVSQTGNYSATCRMGSASSNPSVIYYNSSPPPSPSITISAAPRTIAKASDSLISWSIQHPKTSCSLSARTICVGGICSEQQLEEEARINQIIQTGTIDPSSYQEASSPRSILNSLRYIPASRMDTDWKTVGRKSFNLKHTTEFMISCGATVSQAVRVLITTTGER